jgi:GTP diphosphokinase / guanosine-3',5'-bis(diphosphate) 3'-diphosphatase
MSTDSPSSGKNSDRLAHVILAEDGEAFFAEINRYLSQSDRERVRAAFALARQEHGDQRRRSGETFFIHPLTVAYYLARFNMDAPALMAALLHDVAEDTRVSLEDIAAQFGDEVAQLVNGVTKLKVLSNTVTGAEDMSPTALAEATLHKLLNISAVDVRVALIKLFDRLHNMRTIQAMPLHKQWQKAEETLDIYAPLANRLGVWLLKNELERLSLIVIDPENYAGLTQRLEQNFQEQQPAYDLLIQQVSDWLTQHQAPVLSVEPSPESVYSVYQSTIGLASSYRNVDRSLRLLALLPDLPSCYIALGYIHQLWPPRPRLFDDYIASPRDNLYQSLHTTVFYSKGKPIKIRLRTPEMNEVSEIGVLARWVYAGSQLWSESIEERMQALFAHISQSIELEQQGVSEAVAGVMHDVFKKQIMVFTPRNDVIDLALGATPIDFAYRIHTEVGHRCYTAYVNEEHHPLNKPLREGDQVRILTSNRARPQRIWLDDDLGFTATMQARNRILRWFRRQPDTVLLAEGERLLDEELYLFSLSHSHDEAAQLCRFASREALYRALGRAEILPKEVSIALLSQDWQAEPSLQTGQSVETDSGETYIITGADGRRLRFCRICLPQPGDSIIGFVLNTTAVTIHQEDCHTLRPDPRQERRIKLDWAEAQDTAMRALTVQIDVHDRGGLLLEISELINQAKVNISGVWTRRSPSGGKQLLVEMELCGPEQFVKVTHRIQALVNVYAVRYLPNVSLWSPKTLPSDESSPEALYYLLE